MSLADWHTTWLYISGRVHPGGLQRSSVEIPRDLSSHWQGGRQACFPGEYGHLPEKSLAQGLLGLLAAEGHSVVQETPMVSTPVRCLPHSTGGREGLQSATVLSKASENSSDSSEKCSMIPFHPIITHLREATGPARAPCLGKWEREFSIELWRARGQQRDGNVHPCLLLPFNPHCLPWTSKGQQLERSEQSEKLVGCLFRFQNTWK